MKKIIVAIDGFAGAGKSTTAKRVAQALSYIYIDSGAMYRAATLYFLRNKLDWTQASDLAQALEHIEIDFRYDPDNQQNCTLLNGENVEKEIRKMYISEQVSEVSRVAKIRHKVLHTQRKMGEAKGIVMDGRDIGSKVFPQAELKIFMTADVNIRARRRQEELKERGEESILADIIENLKSRDHIDSTRKESPLVQVDDAHLLDSTHLSIQEQSDFVIRLARQIIER
ncbi:MAG: (d)CMP kinase [Bacteroidota bacterium]